MAEDTQWNDVLREKGILPPRKEKEITEGEIIDMIESAAEKQMKTGKDFDKKTLEELDELSGDEDERVINEYRQKRMQEMKQQMLKSKFGDVREITAESYVEEVNKAGDDIWVALLLYQNSIPLCKIMQDYWNRLSKKFPTVKFIKSVASLCIANFPDKNLPAVFVYYENNLKRQWISAAEFSRKDNSPISIEEMEWKLHELGAVKSDLPENPNNKRPTITGHSILLQNKKINDDDSSDDDW